jgi:hypothetical protein
MSEFTPGPWEVFNEGLGSYKVSKCDAWLGSSTLRTNEENIANANLIAAAPELYRECQNAKARLESVLLNEEAAKAFNNANLDELLSLEISMAIETIEAALKKARGE